MPWYSAGTVAVTNNSPTVTGTGTSFSANARVGDAFRGPDGLWYEVTNVASATVISIKPNYQGANSAAGSYAIAPMQGYVKDSADALRGFVNQYGSLLASLGPLATWQTGQALTLGGNGARIVGDLSSSAGSLHNRLLFVTNQANSQSHIGVMPSGNNTTAAFNVFGSSDPNNCTRFDYLVTGSECRINAGRTGAAAFPPLTIYTSDTERVRVGADGQIAIGSTSGISGTDGLHVAGAKGTLSAMGGFRCRPGVNGAGTNVFNVNWNGVPWLWVDTTNIGQIYIVSSDERIKQDIAPLRVDFRARVRDYEVVTFHFKEGTLWGKNTALQQGFIAQQVRKVNPEAASGEPDSESENGTINPMGINDRAILSDLVGAFQQLEQELEEKYQALQRQEARITELETQLQQVLALLPAA